MHKLKQLFVTVVWKYPAILTPGLSRTVFKGACTGRIRMQPILHNFHLPSCASVESHKQRCVASMGRSLLWRAARPELYSGCFKRWGRSSPHGFL